MSATNPELMTAARQYFLYYWLTLYL